MITQASSEFSICIAINSNDAQLAKQVIDKEFEFEISQKKLMNLRLNQIFLILP